MLQLQATIDGLKTMKNSTLKITLETQDIANFKPEELAELFKMNEKLFWVAFKELEVKEEELDVKELKGEFKNEKSPSQRLRNILFVYWKEQKGKEDFEPYYKRQMEKFIDLIKDKLN